MERRTVLPPTARSAGAARKFLIATLAGTPVDSCTETAALLASELVTNAVLHAHSPVEVRVTVDRDTVRVDVRDQHDRLPEAPRTSATFSGRGLHIVQELADRWGTSPLPLGGKTVWFEVRA